ncbi:hypothetical protein ASPFODRAFT_521565 [Aspergillus luchuensis CBS 106.47]|uniref:Uncharacterized protein n=1 Tax=Aspergillus luchuensis (strain CBS 106.47) TaxID=1137211 RepID=A0A1M3SZ19_ASPLC|nr:hypothetical protein ASPFODRAFT_521565 [Aspergillus luchuensis CBS 106.47]
MLDIESCETGSIGTNYQAADLVLMSDPLEWAVCISNFGVPVDSLCVSWSYVSEAGCAGHAGVASTGHVTYIYCGKRPIVLLLGGR